MLIWYIWWHRLRLPLPLPLLLLLLLATCHTQGRAINGRALNDMVNLNSYSNSSSNVNAAANLKDNTDMNQRTGSAPAAIPPAPNWPLPGPMENDLRIRALMEELVLKSRYANEKHLIDALLPVNYAAELIRRGSNATENGATVAATATRTPTNSVTLQQLNVANAVASNESETTANAASRTVARYQNETAASSASEPANAACSSTDINFKSATNASASIVEFRQALREYPALQPYLHEASNIIENAGNWPANTEDVRGHISALDEHNHHNRKDNSFRPALLPLPYVVSSNETLQAQLNFLQTNAQHIKNQQVIKNIAKNVATIVSAAAFINTTNISQSIPTLELPKPNLAWTQSDFAVDSVDLQQPQEPVALNESANANEATSNIKTTNAAAKVATNLTAQLQQSNMQQVVAEQHNQTIHVNEAEGASLEDATEYSDNEDYVHPTQDASAGVDTWIGNTNYMAHNALEASKDNDANFAGNATTPHSALDDYDYELLRQQLQQSTKKSHYTIVADDDDASNVQHRLMQLRNMSRITAAATIINHAGDLAKPISESTASNVDETDDDSLEYLEVAIGNFIKNEIANVDRSDEMQIDSAAAADMMLTAVNTQMLSAIAATTTTTAMPTTNAAAELALNNRLALNVETPATTNVLCNKTKIIKSEHNKTAENPIPTRRLPLGTSLSFTVNCHSVTAVSAQEQLQQLVSDREEGLENQPTLQHKTIKTGEKSTSAHDDCLNGNAGVEQQQQAVEKRQGYLSAPMQGHHTATGNSKGNDSDSNKATKQSTVEQQQQQSAIAILAAPTDNDKTYDTRKHIKADRKDMVTPAKDIQMHASGHGLAALTDWKSNVDDGQGVSENENKMVTDDAVDDDDDAGDSDDDKNDNNSDVDDRGAFNRVDVFDFVGSDAGNGHGDGDGVRDSDADVIADDVADSGIDGAQIDGIGQMSQLNSEKDETVSVVKLLHKSNDDDDEAPLESEKHETKLTKLLENVSNNDNFENAADAAESDGNSDENDDDGSGDADVDGDDGDAGRKVVALVNTITNANQHSMHHYDEHSDDNLAQGLATILPATTATTPSTIDVAPEIATTNWWHTLSYAEIRKFLNTIFDSAAAHELAQEITRKSKEMRNGQEVVEWQPLAGHIGDWLSADVRDSEQR